MAKRKGIGSFLELSFWTSDIVLKNLTFVMFLGFLAFVYIANAHLAERNVRKINDLQKELKELRWYYRSLEAENMYNSKQSEVAERVREDGLRSVRGKAKKIIVTQED